MSYGTDSYCYDRLVTGQLVSGPELVAQAIYRRLTTARGTLRDGDDGLVYGIDLQDFVGRMATESAVVVLPDIVRAEVLKDDRVERVEVLATPVKGTDGLVSITLELDVYLLDSGEDFTLTLSASAVSVALLGVTT